MGLERYLFLINKVEFDWERLLMFILVFYMYLYLYICFYICVSVYIYIRVYVIKKDEWVIVIDFLGVYN